MAVKFNEKRYLVMFAIIIGLIAFLAYQDIVGANLWGLIGGWEGTAYKTAMPIYLQQFWIFSFMLGIVLAGVYYLFRRDKSETLAIFASFTVLVLSGLEDIFYYLFRGLPLDATLPWLNNNFYIMGVSKLIGLSTVTKESLIISVISGFIITYFIMKKLKRAKW